MKKFYSFGLLLAVLLLGSCSKSEDAAVINTYQSGTSTYMKGNIDGDVFQTEGVSAQWVRNASNPSLEYLLIKAEVYGNTLQGELTFKLRGTRAGTYLTHLQQEVSFKPYGLTSTDAYVAVNPQNAQYNTGQIQLLTVDAQSLLMSGLFNFTAYWTGPDARTPIHFNSGIFQNVPILPFLPQSSPFTAWVDNGTYVGAFVPSTPPNVVVVPNPDVPGTNNSVHFLVSNTNTQLIAAFYFDKTATLGSHTQPTDTSVYVRLENYNPSVAPYDGVITLTEFDVNHHAKGTFSLKFHNPDPTQPDIIMTQGTFDIQF